MNLTLSQLKIVFIAMGVFIVNTAIAQSTQADTLSKFKGTWRGVIMQGFDGKDFKSVSPVFWRIHRIDNSKKKVQLTEIGQQFASVNEIETPKKKLYTGYTQGGYLILKIGNLDANNKHVVKLKFGDNPEKSVLIGTIEKSIGNADNTQFYLFRVDNNTSNYIKPKELAKVEVLPPPQIKNQ